MKEFKRKCSYQHLCRKAKEGRLAEGEVELSYILNQDFSLSLRLSRAERVHHSCPELGQWVSLYTLTSVIGYGLPQQGA